MSGGVAEDDSGSGSAGDDYWFNAQGDRFTLEDVELVAKNNTPATGVVNDSNSPPTRVKVSAWVQSPTSLPCNRIVGGTSVSLATEMISDGNSGSGGSLCNWVYESPVAASALSSFSTVSAVGAGDFQGDVAGFRFENSNGNNLIPGDFGTISSGGWGAGSSIGSLKGSDGAWTGVVTAGTSPSANPTLTLTFHDGPWSAAPVCSTKINATSDSPSQLTVAVTDSPTTTTDVLEFWGTPNASDTYTFASTCTGKSD